MTIVVLVLTSTKLPADTGMCGGVTATLPFTDVMGNTFFCQIAEAYFSGLTNGTSATTFSPADNVPRQQMVAFVTRTQDSALRRASRRAALNQWWTPIDLVTAASYLLGNLPGLVASDGEDLWAANSGDGTVTRVHGSDGRVLGTWTGATGAFGVLVAAGFIVVTGGDQNTALLYFINPQIPGSVSSVGSLGAGPLGIAFDGTYVWTANNSGSVSRIGIIPFTITTITNGFSSLRGILFDGANIWVTDFPTDFLKKLDQAGNILQSVPTGAGPAFPGFDGSNIWVPNFLGNSVTVVRARDGMVLATLTGNGLNQPVTAAFDGQRVVVTNNQGNLLSFWKATDLTPAGTASTAPFSSWGACSDGAHFWITLRNQTAAGKLAQY
jgi:hypothetical protein